MGEQLSLKAAMPLAEILATCRKNVSNTGPSWAGEIHYSDVIMSTMGSQSTGVSIVRSTVGSGWDKKKTSKLHVTGLCDRLPVNSPHKRSVTWKMFPFDDVIMTRTLDKSSRYQPMMTRIVLTELHEACVMHSSPLYLNPIAISPFVCLILSCTTLLINVHYNRH